jgi:hypothetical protein
VPPTIDVAGVTLRRADPQVLDVRPVDFGSDPGQAIIQAAAGVPMSALAIALMPRFDDRPFADHRRHEHQEPLFRD